MCRGSTTGSATANTAVSGLSFSIPFSSAISGNSYSSQVVNSTGVTGLTANLSAGTYSAATGNLTFNVSGTPTSSGAANFTLSYGTGATCTYAINVTAPTVGITNPENTSFSIYPNPAKDRLYLKMNQDREVYYITISDMVGRTKFMLPQPELEKGIDISNLAKGIYTMQVIEKLVILPQLKIHSRIKILMIRRIIIFFILLGFVFRIHAQRNTVLIIADDLSPDYFGFYEIHGDTVAVPNIRKLLGKGVRFKNLMSNPVCSPTRATLLTGRYSFRTGVGGVVGGIGGSNPIDTAEISIPKLLKAYNPSISKGNIGKWHLKNPARL